MGGTENLYIEGDNLEVLKLLQKSYTGKVKVIYIDPPYNTGHDFVYKDDFSDGIDNYLEQTGQTDKEGNQLKTNTESNGRFHTAWLNMMYPRLRLARNLLTQDGVVFISIDDNEDANLRKICDEIFGENNFLAQFIVTRSEGGGLAKQAIVGHDYLLAYTKNISKFIPLGKPKDVRGKVVEKDGIKYWIETDWLRKEFGKYGTLLYEDIAAVKGDSKKKEIDDGIKEGKYILIKRKDKHIVGRYRRLDQDTTKFYTISKHLNKEGVADLQRLNMQELFDYPKPTSLVKEFVGGATIHNKNALVLDFFSGSSTTADAILQLNAEDGGHRKYIMVQLPEKTDEKSVAFKDGYKTIPDIAEERIRRAGKKIKEEHPDADIDTGFKVFTLDKSNIRRWNTEPDKLVEQLSFINNFVEGRSTDDIVYELLLKQGLPLTSKIEKIQLNNCDLFVINEGKLFIALGNGIDVEVAKNILKYKNSNDLGEISVIFQDQGFDGDADKLNTLETLKSNGFKEENVFSV